MGKIIRFLAASLLTLAFNACDEEPSIDFCTPGETKCEGQLHLKCMASGEAWATVVCGEDDANHFCHIESGCVACNEDKHCQLDGKVCSDHVCVACNEDKDCQLDGKVCSDHVCVACNEDKHCQLDGKVCSDHVCVVAADACNNSCTTAMMPICHVNPTLSTQGKCGADCSKSQQVFDYALGLCVKLVSRCKGDNDCEDDYKCNTSTGSCELKQANKSEYRFVRVDDLSDVTVMDLSYRDDPGADIDAVVLKKAIGGNQVYAVKVLGYQRGNGESNKDSKRAFDPYTALGQPDSFTNYPEATTCQYYVTKPAGEIDGVFSFVSLGGKAQEGVKGGYVIVEMDDFIEVNDTLDVLEIGKYKLTNTTDGPTVQAIAENIRVSISITGAETGDWVEINTGAEGVLSTKVLASHLK